jgi:hypothetical protein
MLYLKQNRFYFGDYGDYGFNSPEEYFQAVIDDPFTNPPPEDVAWLFDYMIRLSQVN